MKNIYEKTEWGYYQLQLDEGASTACLKAEFGFEKPPGLVQVGIPLELSRRIRMVSGNAAVASWSAAVGVENASIVAEVVAINPQGNDTIAALKVQVFGKSAQNIPYHARFLKPARADALMLQFFVDLPGAQTFSWALVLA